MVSNEMKKYLDLYERSREPVVKNVIGERFSIVSGVPVFYQIYKSLPKGIPNADEGICYVGFDGKIFIDDFDEVPEDRREKYQDLIALHEKIEYDTLRNNGLPVPRPFACESPVKAIDAHNVAHYTELLAAHRMGILPEYVSWRPKESVTEQICKELGYGSLW